MTLRDMNQKLKRYLRKKVLMIQNMKTLKKAVNKIK
jgi:hypothetical protein